MRRIEDEKIEKYIDELGEEYKTLLFETLVMRSESLNELSVSELLRIDNDVKKYLQRQEESKINRKYLVLGITYVYCGIFLYVFSEIMFKFYDLRYLSPIELTQIISIIIAFVGALACMYPFLRKSNKMKDRKTSEKSESKKLLEYEVVSTWRELEGICNDIALKNDIITNISVIQLLRGEGLISEAESRELTHFLKLRNSVVHGNKMTISQEEISKQIKRIDKLIGEINLRLLPGEKNK